MIAGIITGCAVVVGVSTLIYKRIKKRGNNNKPKNDKEKKDKDKNKKLNNELKIKKIKDNSSISSSEKNTEMNIDNSQIFSEISDANLESILIPVKNEIEIIDNNNDVEEDLPPKSSIKTNSSHSSHYPFKHDYENVTIENCAKNKYTIGNLIGTGTVGLVYSGINEQTGEDIVIKIINIKGNEKLKELSEEEVQIMMDFANLDNAVKYIDSGILDDDFFIVMEKCDKSLKDCEMTEEKIREMLIQFIPVFNHLNEKNIIHRDIKPDNILIKYDKNGKPIYKLCDFGISKYAKDKNYSCYGCRGYMSPQIDNEEGYTNKADIYSLGATIYYLLFGKKPTSKNIIFKKFDHSPKDKDLNDLLFKMLAYEEKDRISWKELISHPFIKRNEINIINEKEWIWLGKNKNKSYI